MSDVDGLKILQLGRHAPVVVVVLEVGSPLEERHARLLGADAEILEIAAVAHRGNVHLAAQAALEIRDFADVKVAAVGAGLGIVRQVARLDLAMRFDGQEAELAAEFDAAGRQILRRERHVVVRRQVEIIGYADLIAVRSRVVENRHEQPALAFRTERKRKIRRIEDRYALEFHPRPARNALVRHRIERDRRRLQHPVPVADRAGRVADLIERDLAARTHRDLAGRTAARAVEQFEVCMREIRPAGLIVAAAVALDPNQRVFEVDRARDRDPGALAVVGHGVGRHAALVLAHGHAAAQFGTVLVAHDRGVAVDVDQMIVGGDGRRGARRVMGRRRAHVPAVGEGAAAEADEHQGVSKRTGFAQIQVALQVGMSAGAL